MLKKTLIAAATAVALTGAAVSTAVPASAATAGTTDVSWNGGWNGQNQWKGSRHGGHKNWNARRACEPIIRWKKVGYRYHRRWQPIVVGWNCGHGGHKGHKGHNNRTWK
jgi:hypothetical protein